MRKIYVFDTTLRDGEQSPGVNLNTREKVEIAHQLERLGIDRMEAGFPAASPGDLAAVNAVAKAVKNVTVIGLSRSREQDIDAVKEALKGAQDPCIHIFLATSLFIVSTNCAWTEPRFSIQLVPQSVMQRKLFQRSNSRWRMQVGPSMISSLRW